MEWPPMYESRKEHFERGPDGVIRDKGILTEMIPAFHRGEVRIESTDIFVCSYPRSGTNWISSIVSLIKFHGDQELMLKHSVDKPYLEPLLGLTKEQKIKKLNAVPPESRVFNTHLWPEQLPPTVFEKNCKIIYIMRNPKDNAVSLYHFHRATKMLGQIKDWPFSKFFPYYMAGNLTYGSWFDHVKKWWQHRRNPNILFVKYEDVIKNHEDYIRKLAKFMNVKLTDDEVKSIVKQSEFKSMRKFIDEMSVEYLTKMTKGDEGEASGFNLAEMHDNTISHFIRKGKVGDWKNHFTVSESEAYDKLYQKNMAETDLTFDFE